jgi:hypothetical protein
LISQSRGLGDVYKRQPTYTVLASDRAASINVTVTGTKLGFITVAKTTANSAPVTGPFASIGTPTISGTVAMTKQLTANPGIWSPNATFTYQWLRRALDSNTPVEITGAKSATYTLTSADRGLVISVRVSGTLSGYFVTPATSVETDVVMSPFVSAPSPAIAGTLRVGQTVTANPGAWNPSGPDTILTYQWFANGLAITDATASTLVLEPSLVGRVITVKVTATRDTYAATTVSSANSAPVQAAPLSFTPTPTIQGSPLIGQVLTVDLGNWDADVAFSYQWKRASTIVGTGSSYTVQASDRANGLTVTVTGSKLGYVTTVKTSSPTAPAAGPFSTVGTPSFSANAGQFVVGSVLTANPGTWSPAPQYRYQWLRGGAPIVGATAQTYTPVAADYQTSISVRVTASLLGYLADPQDSSATTIGAGTFKSIPTPSITGSLKIGGTLTISAPNWTPAAAFSYKWFANGAEISGALGQSWIVDSGHAGQSITAQVFGSAPGYNDANVVTAARSDWSWSTTSVTYTGYGRFSNCINWTWSYYYFSWQNIGHTFEPCGTYGASGVSIYSAGYGGVLGGNTEVLSYVDIPLSTRRYKLTFNGARTYSSFYASSSTASGTSPQDTIGFPIGYNSSNVPTGWITPRSGDRAYFVIFASQSGFLRFDSVTVTYEYL